jgi:hypothetical protein
MCIEHCRPFTGGFWWGLLPVHCPRDVRKIVYARKFNVHMVMAEWLLDCAAEGRRVAEVHYKPAGDINMLQVRNNKSVAAAAPEY